jgi:hypothetical protein
LCTGTITETAGDRRDAYEAMDEAMDEADRLIARRCQ